MANHLYCAFALKTPCWGSPVSCDDGIFHRSHSSPSEKNNLKKDPLSTSGASRTENPPISALWERQSQSSPVILALYFIKINFLSWVLRVSCLQARGLPVTSRWIALKFVGGREKLNISPPAEGLSNYYTCAEPRVEISMKQ